MHLALTHTISKHAASWGDLPSGCLHFGLLCGWDLVDAEIQQRCRSAASDPLRSTLGAKGSSRTATPRGWSWRHRLLHDQKHPVGAPWHQINMVEGKREGEAGREESGEWRSHCRTGSDERGAGACLSVQGGARASATRTGHGCNFSRPSSAFVHRPSNNQHRPPPARPHPHPQRHPHSRLRRQPLARHNRNDNDRHNRNDNDRHKCGASPNMLLLGRIVLVLGVLPLILAQDYYKVCASHPALRASDC